jgi:CheY-like chemotaxis protein
MSFCSQMTNPASRICRNRASLPDYVVIATSDGFQALEFLRTASRIELVLGDVQMGDGCMNGLELAAEVTAQRPSLP